MQTKRQTNYPQMSYKKVKLSEICTIEKGTTGITKAVEGIYPMVTMAEARTSHNEYQFDTKAVIIPLVSSSGHGHASMKRIHYQEGKFAIGSILCAVIPKNEDEVNARFLYNYLHFQRESILVPLMRGAANVSLSIKSVSGVEIDLPSINEQIAINQLVDDFKEKNQILQTENQTQAKLLQKLRKAYLQEAVTGLSTADWRQQNPTQDTGKALLTEIKKHKAQLIKEGKLRKEKPLNPIKPEEIPFQIPDNWTWCRLGEVELFSEYGTSEKADLNSSNIPVLRMGNVQNMKIDYNNLKYLKSSITDLPKLYLKGRDLIFNRTNSFELVGKSAVFNGENDTITFASYLIRIRFLEFISSDYINFWINSSDCRKTQIEPNTIQQNGQANFNGTKLKNILIPLPPLTEQQAIVSKIEGLLAQVEGLEKENKAQQVYAQRLMGAVLQEAFGG